MGFWSGHIGSGQPGYRVACESPLEFDPFVHAYNDSSHKYLNMQCYTKSQFTSCFHDVPYITHNLIVRKCRRLVDLDSLIIYSKCVIKKTTNA